MSSLKVGDVVRVTDWGKSYSTNKLWFKEHEKELNIDWLIRFAYGDNRKYLDKTVCKHDTCKYIVLFIDDVFRLALITSGDEFDSVYLISTCAIVPCRKRMTLKEVETILGYSIEIVG